MHLDDPANHRPPSTMLLSANPAIDMPHSEQAT